MRKTIRIMVLLIAGFVSGCVSTSTISDVRQTTTVLGTSVESVKIVLNEDLNWFLSYPPTFREDSYISKGELKPEGEDSDFVYFRSANTVRFVSIDPLGGKVIIEKEGNGGIYMAKNGKSKRAGFYMSVNDTEVERLMKFDKSFFDAKGVKWKIE